MNDPISDFLTRIRNACSAQQEQVFIPFSKMKAELSRILQEEGYIWGYEVDTNTTHPRLKLKLKYQDKSSRHPQDRPRQQAWSAQIRRP
jgi:small subunit ribosomal protein S8